FTCWSECPPSRVSSDPICIVLVVMQIKHKKLNNPQTRKGEVIHVLAADPRAVALSPEDVASRLGFKTSTVAGWIRGGRLPAKRIGEKLRVTEADLAVWI